MTHYVRETSTKCSLPRILSYSFVFAKIAIRKKICCTTYKKTCIYQKKAVPLQHER